MLYEFSSFYIKVKRERKSRFRRLWGKFADLPPLICNERDRGKKKRKTEGNTETEKDRKSGLCMKSRGVTLLTTATEYYGGGKVIYSTKSDIRRYKKEYKENTRKCI